MKKIIFILLVSTFIFAQNKSTITIKDPWIRINAKGANSALFFVAENNSDKPDTLVSAKFDGAEVVELHETYKKSDDMMGMRAVKFVAIPAKGSVSFKPRDLHIMLIGLKDDLKLNDKHEITLKFKNAGDVKIKAVVRDMQRMMK